MHRVDRASNLGTTTARGRDAPRARPPAPTRLVKTTDGPRPRPPAPARPASLIHPMGSESGLWGSLRRAVEDDAGSQPGGDEPDGPDLPYCGLSEAGCNGRSPSCACVDYLFDCDPTSGTCSPITIGTAALLVVVILLCCWCWCCCCYCRERSGSPEHSGGCLESCCRMCLKICTRWLRCTRVLAVLCCVGLLGSGAWFIFLVKERDAVVKQYNDDVRQWSLTFSKPFRNASFSLEFGVAAPDAASSGQRFTLTRESGVEDMNVIPPGYYSDLEQYTPMQYITEQILAHDVAANSSALINVTLLATTKPASTDGSISYQRLPVGSFQMVGEWPATSSVCEGSMPYRDGASRNSNGQCQILRAVQSLCLVVSWKGSMEGWDWRRNAKGCYGTDRERGYGDWVFASDLEDRFDGSPLAGWQAGQFEFGAGVFEEHDPFLMVQGDKLDILMSRPEQPMHVCFAAAAALALCTVGMVACERKWRRNADSGAGAGADVTGGGALAGPLLSSSSGGGGGGGGGGNQGINATY